MLVIVPLNMIKTNYRYNNIYFTNTGGYLLQQWNIKCNDKNINGKKQNFIKSTKPISPTGYSGAMCHHLIIMVILFLSVSNEQILIKLVI